MIINAKKYVRRLPFIETHVTALIGVLIGSQRTYTRVEIENVLMNIVKNEQFYRTKYMNRTITFISQCIIFIPLSFVMRTNVDKQK